MKAFIKKIFPYLPRFGRRVIIYTYEKYGEYLVYINIGKHLDIKSREKIKKNIIFYHISGLSFGGTEKLLQILAKYINKEKYNVFFMYSPKPRSSSGNIPLDGRKHYLENSRIELIEFQYKNLDQTYPYIVRDMNPLIFEIINTKSIDLFITAGSGYGEFPFNFIKNTPIVLLNIFGSPTTQKNILKNICISNEVANKIKPVVDSNRIEVMYIPSEGPTTESIKLGTNLRQQLNLKESDVVFGRIGRADNGIFDPIGIRAFQQVVQEHPEAHYIIMSPPPLLEEIVSKEKIPHVHFLRPSANENDIWAFHQAIDVLAHFRYDGESCGLNIIESLLCSKPVITHKSHIWNAHLEYLEPTFSKVAEKDNIEQYAKYMKEMIEAKKEGSLREMGRKAKEKADPLFLIQHRIGKFEQWIDVVLE